jgi:two-component system response regulator PilR (NtrC family)
MRKEIKGVKKEVITILMQHEWKGEIRELENIIERAVIFCNDGYLSLADLPEFLQIEGPSREDASTLSGAIHDFERKFIRSILQRHNFDKEKVAVELKISLPTLYRRIKDLGIADK